MTCEQLLKSLTAPQRRAFEKLSRDHRVFAPVLSSERRPYAGLVKAGLAKREFCALGLTFVLTDFGQICNGPVACVPA